jgi:hypothetical protein
MADNDASRQFAITGPARGDSLYSLAVLFALGVVLLAHHYTYDDGE